MTANDHETPFFEKHREICAAANLLQEALRRALHEIFPAETSTRAVGRRLGIDKTLGWQTLRIANAPDPATVLAALPGDRGLNLLLEGLAREGASRDAVALLGRRADELRSIFERLGSSPREVLAIASGGLDATSRKRTLHRMLKLQYESSVAIRGEAGAAEYVAWIVTRAAKDPSLVTLVSLFMVCGLRTIRPLGPRIVYRGSGVASGVETGDYSEKRYGPMPLLVPPASSPDLDRCGLEFKQTPHGRFVLANPDSHPDGSLTLGFAERLEAVGSLHRSPTDRTGEVATQIALPIRHHYFDVLFDTSLPEVEPAAALYFSSAQGVEHGRYAELRRFTGEVEGRLVRSLALPASSDVDPERHRALLEHGASLVDRSLGAFRCYRVHLEYPPTYTRAVVRWLLPDPPKA